jgi:hypothetical protein
VCKLERGEGHFFFFFATKKMGVGEFVVLPAGEIVVRKRVIRESGCRSTTIGREVRQECRRRAVVCRSWPAKR